MRIDRTIAAMRADRAIQRRAQAIAGRLAARWRDNVRIAPVLAQLADFGRGSPLSRCPALAALFEPGEAAAELAESFCGFQSEALRTDRFVQVAFRHSWDGRSATLLLGRAGRAQLTLVAVEPGRHSARSVVFSDAVRHEAVLAGRALALRTERDDRGSLAHHDLEMSQGERIALDLGRQALFARRVERRLVSLRLHRTNPHPAPIREYDVVSGLLSHRASGDARASRHEIMLALLGRMERRDAAPVMAALAREPGQDSLRWEALREALALDTAEGFRALGDVARAAGDSLALPAGALHAELIEAHPELRALGDERCHA